MKIIITGAAFVSLLVCLSAMAPRAVADPLLSQEVDDAIASFKNSDSGMSRLFRQAQGYVVFPNIGKGGFVVGAAHGDGLVFEKGKMIGLASMTQVTVGAQVGGQVYSEVIFFENQTTLLQFKESRMEMSAQVGAVAAAEGVAQNARYVDGVLVFTKVKTGLMAEASVGGQKFNFVPIVSGTGK
jgi:lipid-binding SYLF domain-containing protein